MSKHIPEEVITRLRAEIAAALPALTMFRRHLHQHPELGLQETQTSALLRDALAELPMTLWEPLIGTDVVGELAGASARTIILRADIDAVALDEQTDLPYSSATPGIMHACGHDGHATMLLGAARVLSAVQSLLPVTVRFVFQPGEEMRYGGKTLVERGVCEGVDAVYALHGWPGVPLGMLSTRPGALFAAGGEFTITVNGRGCHGAMPERGLNPIPIAARVITELFTLHQRWQSQSGAVISTCMAQAGLGANVIPDTAVLRGTARYLDVESGLQIVDDIRACCAAIAAESGAEILVEYRASYDLPVRNTPAGYAHVREMCERYLPGKFMEALAPTMAIEDFAFYLPGRDGAMTWLGLGASPPLHASTFDFNDELLGIGILTLCLLAISTE